jgi:hypothetical protein
MLLGFSTGCLYQTHERLAPETFDVFRKIGANAIELVWSDIHVTSQLLSIKPEHLEGFEYISVHVPSFDGHNEVEIAGMLKVLEQAHAQLGFNSIVIHPYETMNWDLFKQFDLPFVIENMDWTKEFGKYVESMQDIFDNLDVPMALDLNHCFTNDPSMLLAQDMVENFKDRIEHIHISGFETMHELLYKTQQQEILTAIPDKSLPIIIESGCETIDDAQKEFDFISSYLKK